MIRIKNYIGIYNEILKTFDGEVGDVFVMDRLNQKVSLGYENLILFVCSEMRENTVIASKLLQESDNLYIAYSDFKSNIDNVDLVEILNIGSKYKINILLRTKINKKRLMHISLYIAMLISDIVIINKVSSIEKGLDELDLALDLGKDVCAVPGDIFEYKNYLANFAIKQGAMPICNAYDVKYLLREKAKNVL